MTIYVYCSEIFPTHIRVKGMAWAICVFMITDIPFLETFTNGVAVIGWRYYLVFIIMAVVCVPMLWFFCPEVSDHFVFFHGMISRTNVCNRQRVFHSRRSTGFLVIMSWPDWNISQASRRGRRTKVSMGLLKSSKQNRKGTWSDLVFDGSLESIRGIFRR